MLPGIGLFGTGNIVRVIVPFLREKGFKVEAIWGRTLAEASQVAHDLQIPFFTNQVDDVLLKKDVDLIFILCAPHLHAQISVKALGIGKHVLCDKPSGLSQIDALKMVRAALYYPSLISILNHSLRFLPAFIHMKNAIGDGVIGKINLIEVQLRMGTLLHDTYDWLCDEKMGGGALTMVGSHVIDLISHLTGQRATKVHAVIRTFNKDPNHVTQNPFITGIRTITAPDFCSFQMELEGGVLVTANLNTHMTSAFTQEILVCGTIGHLIVKGCNLYSCQGSDEKVVYSESDDTPQTDSSLPGPYLNGLCKMITALKEAFLPVEDKKGWVKQPVLSAATFEDGLYVQVSSP